jgi:hypothetical protein
MLDAPFDVVVAAGTQTELLTIKPRLDPFIRQAEMLETILLVAGDQFVHAVVPVSVRAEEIYPAGAPHPGIGLVRLSAGGFDAGPLIA